MISLAYGALWLFIFAVPWENMIVIPGVGTISKLLGIVALGCALLAAVLSGRLRRWRLFHLAALLFVMWTGWNTYQGGIVKVGDALGTLNKFKTYVQLFVVLWITWELAPTLRRQIGLLLAYLAGAYVAALNTVLVYRSHAAVFRRFSAEGFDPNDLAMTLALALPIAWYLGMTYRQPLLRWLCRGFLPLGLVAIGLSGSRGGLVAAVVGLTIVPLTMSKLSPGKIVAAIVLLMASGAIAIASIPHSTLQRLSTTKAEMEGGDLNGRLEIWKAGIEALLQRPVAGYGTGGFDRAVRPFLGAGRAAHNSYLAVVVEQGLVGFLLFATMFLAVVPRVMKLPSLERRFGLVLLATVMTAMLPLSWDNQKTAWVIPALLVGLAEATVQLRAGMAAQPAPARGATPVIRRPPPRARATTGSPPPGTPAATPGHDA